MWLRGVQGRNFTFTLIMRIISTAITAHRLRSAASRLCPVNVTAECKLSVSMALYEGIWAFSSLNSPWNDWVLFLCLGRKQFGNNAVWSQQYKIWDSGLVSLRLGCRPVLPYHSLFKSTMTSFLEKVSLLWHTDLWFDQGDVVFHMLLLRLIQSKPILKNEAPYKVKSVFLRRILHSMTPVV